MNSFKVTRNNEKIQPPNYIGLIQRWLKLSENKIGYDMLTVRNMTDSIVKYIENKALSEQTSHLRLRSSEIKFNILKGTQRIVRAKYKGWIDIKNMKDFIPNPNPNKKGK